MCVYHDIGPRIYIYRGPIDEEDETVDASIFLWPSIIDSAGTMSKAERISISNCQLEFSGLVWGFSGVTENRRISLLIQMGPEESPGMLGFCGCLLRTEKDHDLWWCKVFFATRKTASANLQLSSWWSTVGHVFSLRARPRRPRVHLRTWCR